MLWNNQHVSDKAQHLLCVARYLEAEPAPRQKT